MKLHLFLRLAFMALAAVIAWGSVAAQEAHFKRGDANQDDVVNTTDLGVIGDALSRFIRGDANIDGQVTLADAAVIGSMLPQFKRGDANQDDAVNLTDSIYLNNYLFQGGPAPPCMDAADVNDDGSVNNSDPIYLNNWLYKGGPAPPPPGPSTCSYDPTEDTVSCLNTWCVEADQGCKDAADLDDSGTLEITDYNYLILWLFHGGPAPQPPFPDCGVDPIPDSMDCRGGNVCVNWVAPCWDAADINDDGLFGWYDYLDLEDYLLSGGPQPPPPGPLTCGPDPTPDSLGCENPICQ